MRARRVGWEWSALGAAMALSAQAWSGAASAAQAPVLAGPAARGAERLGLQLGHPRIRLKVGHSYAATIVQPLSFRNHGFEGGERGEHVTIEVTSAGRLTISLDASGENHGFTYGADGRWAAANA